MSAQDELTLVLASDERGMIPLCVALWSVMEKAEPTTSYHFCLFYLGIPEEKREELRQLVARGGERHRISFVDAAPYVQRPELSLGKLPATTWARIFAPEVLPDVHKALYIDIDTVTCMDLKPLFDTPLDGKAAGVVLESLCGPKADFIERLGMPMDCMGYFNAGVILMNLDFFRQENLTQRLIDYSAAHPEGLLKMDQDALNAVLYPYLVKLHPRWNWNDGFTRRILKADPDAKTLKVYSTRECVEAAYRPGIIHYIGPKPWRYNHRYGRKLWEDCLLRSGVVKELHIPGWNFGDFFKRLIYTPLYALTDRKIRKLTDRWGIK